VTPQRIAPAYLSVVKKRESNERAHTASSKPARGGRSRKRGGRKKSATHSSAKSAAGHSHRELTSLPTTRNAQIATRAWLLKHYGPHCAYCGLKVESRTITLDHVAPRRGQTAYDSRDNLVLACRPCNALKRDQAPLAFLLARRSRVANLLKYGAHLSAGLLDLARPLLRESDQPPAPAAPPTTRPGRIHWGASDDDGPSPYRDE
jgi:5-methylcytosine-specific restriction endonuclease McrA